MATSAQTRLVALLGHPVAHSLSPRLHNAAFQAQDLDFAYLAFSVPPANLADAVVGLRTLGFAGGNVTLPHKNAALALCDTCSDAARYTGAVNTLVYDATQDILHGDNTDVAGFLVPLLPLQTTLQHAEMVVFGAGGAARAVVYALLTTFAPKRLTLVVRNLQKVKVLAEDFSTLDGADVLHILPLAEAQSAVQNSRLLVNTTPVGMTPHTDATIWPNLHDFHASHIAYDLIYTPAETVWMRTVRAQGGHVIGGQTMFLAQASAAYQQWTGRAMPEALLQNLF